MELDYQELTLLLQKKIIIPAPFKRWAVIGLDSMSAFIAGKLIQTVGTILRWLTLFVVSKFKGVSSPKYDEVSHGFESEDEYQKVVRRWGNYGFGLFFFAVLLLIYHFIYLT